MMASTAKVAAGRRLQQHLEGTNRCDRAQRSLRHRPDYAHRVQVPMLISELGAGQHGTILAYNLFLSSHRGLARLRL